MDTAEQVQFIAATYGLAQCDVDVTYNLDCALCLSRPRRDRRRARCASCTTARWTSHGWRPSNRLTRRIRREAISHRTKRTTRSQPSRRRRTRTTDGPRPWPGLRWRLRSPSCSAAGSSLPTVAFLTTMVIDRVNRVLNRFGLPFFFQQVVGGLIAAAPRRHALYISGPAGDQYPGRRWSSRPEWSFYCPGCRWWARSRTRSWVHPLQLSRDSSKW